ncbi:Alpha/Beta hydrolase protein [Dipodascopsis uninucleata]
MTVAVSPVDSYKVHGLVVEEYVFECPLDYLKPDSKVIKVFARRVLPSEDTEEEGRKRPYIVYLQGGPGFECDPPLSKSGRTKELIDRGYQILYLDQRGTGYSTPVSYATLKTYGTDAEKANYLSKFRADNIVRDCEEIRHMLLKDSVDKRWSLLGQSFGGFCAVTYLSFFPNSLKDVLITGGVPPLVNNPDAVYKVLYGRVIKRNRAYYKKFPNDVAKVRKILDFLNRNQVVLPNGGRLTPERFQQFGLDFGRHTGLDVVHQLVSKVYHDLSQFNEITYSTKSQIQFAQSFDTNVLYACMHEAIYCQGEASAWSADRLRLEYKEYFSWETISALDEQSAVYFTGEMIYRSMFDDYAELRGLKGAAEVLAMKSDWPALYDIPTLELTKARVSAVSYYNDIYVDLDLSVEAASHIRDCRQWVTSEFLHNGLTVNPNKVLGELFRLLETDIE